MKPQIHSDGITVWVNTDACIGRFGRAGIDIHMIPGKEGPAASECLFCTHTWSTKEDWETFKVKMQELHGVNVPDKYMPERFKVNAGA